MNKAPKKEEKTQKSIRCVVVSDKMQKSRVGKINRIVKHPVVEKYIKRSSKIMFHDEKNETKIGDEVVIVQTRPISSRKAFRLDTIITRYEG